MSFKLNQDLDHRLWKLIRQLSLQEKKILVALSGGVDSVALLRSLSKVQKTENLGAAYFHHGDDANIQYRNEALVFCADLCKQWNITFYALKMPLHQTQSQLQPLSEAHYREKRYEALRSLMDEQGFEVLATGHHRDDLLETRLLRLIRGTGIQGLQAMETFKGHMFRPFLEVSKYELNQYLEVETIKSCEDPSNGSTDPFRNWIRQEWLVALEKRQKGAVGSLARSLELLTQEVQRAPAADLLSQNGVLINREDSHEVAGISRAFYLTLTHSEQRRLLAQFLFWLGKKDFSQAHLEEIQKRLDSSQKVITFKVGGGVWQINAEQIMVQS